MGGTIDPQRQARDDRRARAPRPPSRSALRCAVRLRWAVACPTIATRRRLERLELAADEQHRRRQVDRPQTHWVLRVVERDRLAARALGPDARWAIGSAGRRPDRLERGRRQGSAGPRVPPPRPTPAPRHHRVRATDRATARAPPSRSTRRSNVSGPTPGVHASATQASRSATLPPPPATARPRSRCRSRARVDGPRGPSRPTPEHQLASWSGERPGRRAEPGRLVEVLGEHALGAPSRSAMVRATRSSRSVPRAVIRVEVRELRGASLGRRHRGAHAARSARPASWPLTRPGVRRTWRRRAAAIRVATTALDSGAACRDQRDGRDPVHRDPQVDAVAQRPGDPAARIARRRSVGQRQARCSLPNQPHGQGFIAAISVNRAGNVSARPARAIATRPSSSGWRSASSTSRPNSGSSSRNSTPWSASVISPGDTRGPPPTIAAYDIVWCGARNGGRRTQRRDRALAGDRGDDRRRERRIVLEGGQQRGHRAREQRLARPRRPDEQQRSGHPRGRSRAPAAPPAGHARRRGPGTTVGGDRGRDGAGIVSAPPPAPPARPGAADRRRERGVRQQRRPPRPRSDTPISASTPAPAAPPTGRRRARRCGARRAGRAPRPSAGRPGTVRTSPPSDSSPSSAQRPASRRTCSEPRRMPDRDRQVERGARPCAARPARG